MDYQQIIYDIDEGILTITLNRPDKLNAFTGQMMTEMINALDRADADDTVKAIIVTGAGRGFCAGADLSSGASTFDADASAPKAAQEEKKSIADGGGLLTLRIFDCLKPIISACNGPAVGVGATMQCAMDIRLASTSAKYGFVFSKRGIVPEACSSWFLPRLVGISQALEWTYTGRVFSAEEALEKGLIRSVHEPEDLLPAARKLALEFADQTSSLSIALIRNMMWKMLGADHPVVAHNIDSRGVNAMGKSTDAKEGVASFLEKRPAIFPGKVSAEMPEFFPWWERREFE
ncbi:crotonase/enoyl-CoA hydratase family protein [Pseudomonadales bacterium]|jgi:enoyl-CoA hydratase/carnithine racemase|nr:crotonase/enoyl-CoA hydratase family protein [Gammaproteobacteria bacterium]MDC0995162.1 crotonase/enoyl-CoA hydratase family protein [Pseudomonadales bacterium]MBT3737008.1 crotonase/enoyl-CoA hydratase family protein [Gammaproteobacteria bacterium]MBT7538019.1 crotonase/enoyl-CoA hydratase family protein [Gammaproteobacteria bacterium]MDC1478172.1 crotonase/enoyl-CoA hydratase family protein [Pseudomonadales bacterium]|tara:strand:+ start:123 stop:992 length:870 start_codon:yes stop_codon:yes gene_type:complete